MNLRSFGRIPSHFPTSCYSLHHQTSPISLPVVYLFCWYTEMLVMMFGVDTYCGLVYIGQWQLERTWPYTERGTVRVDIAALIGYILSSVSCEFTKPPKLVLYKPVCSMLYCIYVTEDWNPWSKVFLDKMLSSQLVKRFHTQTRTLRHIIVFTTDNQLILT